jgi:hypothetical protein
VATNRRILVQVTLPAVLTGLLLLGTCLIGLWSINRLQANRSSILSKNVRSLQVAREMEIRLRQSRFHAFIYLMDRTPERRSLVDEDHRQFEQALAEARQLASLPEEQDLIDSVEAGFMKEWLGRAVASLPPSTGRARAFPARPSGVASAVCSSCLASSNACSTSRACKGVSARKVRGFMAAPWEG